MLSQTKGITAADENPVKNAIVTLISFFCFSTISLLPYIICAFT